jgi:formamidopyrimidine-DNA glycosylase
VQRVGKVVAIELQRGTARSIERRWLCVHLRMTGRLLCSPAGEASVERKARYLRARLELDGAVLLFCDLRRFGTLRLCRSIDEAAPTGLDPFSPELTSQRLGALLRNGKQAIKVWLLRQDRLAGLGNIYASEVLFAARIDPRRPASSLDRTEVGRLYRALRRILNKAIQHCGTTFSDFQDSRGEIGGYRRFLKVYKREGMPCARCGERIQRLVQQQRSTFYCPSCQTL